MIDIQYIRENPETVAANATRRRMDVDITRLIEVDAARRNQIGAVEELRAQRNTISEQLKETQGKDTGLVEQGKALKETLGGAEDELVSLDKEYAELMSKVPNMTHEATPDGFEDADSVTLKEVGKPTVFDFEPLDHVELGKKHNLLDFEAAARVAGSGFYYTKNELVNLEFALVQFSLGIAGKYGFTPMTTPDLARNEILLGTGYQPRGEETQIYSVENTDLSLIATAEIPVAGYYAGTTISAKDIETPIRIAAVSHCFRTEDGAYGKESRGLYRVHQFTKVELFVFCKPEDSEAEHTQILAIEEEIMQSLNIPYRVLDICVGDLGASAYRKFDIEAWMPFKNGYGEVTSASTCTDFQARRLNIRYETPQAENKSAYVHTLNGTAFASSRLPIAILENNQNADGSITIPAALHPFMHSITQIG